MLTMIGGPRGRSDNTARMSRATTIASSSVASGRISANSSLPSRAITSVVRALARRISETDLSMTSPAARP